MKIMYKLTTLFHVIHTASMMHAFTTHEHLWTSQNTTAMTTEDPPQIESLVKMTLIFMASMVTVFLFYLGIQVFISRGNSINSRVV